MYLALKQMTNVLLLPLAVPHHNTAAHVYRSTCTGSAIALQQPPPPLIPQEAVRVALMPLCVQLACAHLLNSSFSDVSGSSEIPHEAVIATGEVCSPEDTCAYNGRCLSRCCQPNIAKPDNVAECNQDGWMASCKSGYEWVPGIGCDMVPGKVHLP